MPPSDPVELRFIMSRDMSSAAVQLCAALRTTAINELEPFGLNAGAAGATFIVCQMLLAIRSHVTPNSILIPETYPCSS